MHGTCDSNYHVFVNASANCLCGAERRDFLMNGYYDSFVESNWFYEPAEHGGMPEIGYTGLALAEEAGEAAGKIKKFYRDSRGVQDYGNTTALVKELGDSLYYLTKLAHLFGHTLDSIARANVEKLRDRAARGKMRGSGDER